ncbi:hypothetical protein QBE52_00665 [Clostridiaceae bacterium 35-E11]
MKTPDNFFLILLLGSGLCWIVTYILIIKRGFQDKTYGMPMVAICANISWEFIFSFIYPHNGLQNVIDIIWFILDIVIMLQYLSYGGKEFKKYIPVKFFYPSFFITLGVSFLTIMAITLEFNDFEGKYAAFLQNLMMYGLFIALLIKRGNLNGQSIYIAVFKMVGSLLAAIAFIVYFRSYLITIISVAMLIYDWIYIFLVCKSYSKRTRNQINYST